MSNNAAREQARQERIRRRKVAYYEMADNLAKNGHADVAIAVRALSLRDDDTDIDFTKALLPGVADEIVLAVVLAAKLRAHADDLAVDSTGKKPVVGLIRASAALAAIYESVALKYLQTDDAVPVAKEQIETWQREGREAALKFDEMIGIIDG